MRGSVKRYMAGTAVASALVAVAISAISADASTPTLGGTVGDAGITLKRSGTSVTKLKPGTYTFKINDTSSEHNFHLKGPGGVNKKTTVDQVKRVTWTVKLSKGTYTF